MKIEVEEGRGIYIGGSKEDLRNLAVLLERAAQDGSFVSSAGQTRLVIEREGK